MTLTHNAWPVAIIGSGDVGIDLMIKVLNDDGPLTVAVMVGSDPDSDGLVRAARIGVPTTARGVDGLLAMPHFGDIRIVFDTTSADTHRDNWAKLADTGVRMLDLTTASIGPFCVPAVNPDDHLDAPNLNMVTGDGQATVPIVAAVAQNGIVSYAEIVSSMASKSAGPEIRSAIDEFAETTVAAVEVVGGAQRGRAMIILNTAVPPMAMRSTVYCLVAGDADHQRIESDVLAVVDKVRAYVPGYRLKQRIQFETFSMANPLYIPETGKFTGTRVTVLMEIVGATDYLPSYAGNLDMMTAAAKATAERIAAGACAATETAGLPT
jgi:acetaldehyde dehydrogenase